MAETDSEIWREDTLRVEDGEVVGQAFTKTFEGGCDIVATVASYTYERGGETRENHVPLVVVSDPGGFILSEPHAKDSSDPELAIEYARTTAQYVYRNYEDYI